jgi:hypothetical protein
VFDVTRTSTAVYGVHPDLTYVATYTGVNGLGGVITAIEIRLLAFPELMFVSCCHGAQWNRVRVGPAVSLTGGIYHMV